MTAMCDRTLRQSSGKGVRVQLLDGGSFSTSTSHLLHAGAAPDSFRLYDWCFYIYHEPSNRHVLWDLGCIQNYTPWVQLNMVWRASPVGPRKPIADQLAELGVDSRDIDTVIFSHAHWDHCRPISDEFPNATAYFGPGTNEFCSPGHLASGSGEPNPEVEWDGRYFGGPEHVTERWAELPSGGCWVSFASFDRALDFFGDGSLWIIDAPGHMPGNLCAAARLEGSGEWVILGSDCCHSQEILRGERHMATFQTETGETKAYLHKDLTAATDTLIRIREAQKRDGMHVALAHDASWMTGQGEKTDAVLMSLLHKNKKGEWLARVARGERP
ncbi:beta-lactamase-like protein [Microdochium bolleyi]|uniref:Beta-lactamase-like protein n=1 Tax=Microdochium bolleyi TaxID=196109 RepID=A0A136ISF5_9PEZI|nr:beta-lactamase-like protein [Microdochium bolleyi]